MKSVHGDERDAVVEPLDVLGGQSMNDAPATDDDESTRHEQDDHSSLSSGHDDDDDDSTRHEQDDHNSLFSGYDDNDDDAESFGGEAVHDETEEEGAAMFDGKVLEDVRDDNDNDDSGVFSGGEETGSSDGEAVRDNPGVAAFEVLSEEVDKGAKISDDGLMAQEDDDDLLTKDELVEKGGVFFSSSSSSSSNETGSSSRHGDASPSSMTTHDEQPPSMNLSLPELLGALEWGNATTAVVGED